jgi:hypothetical protein
MSSIILDLCNREIVEITSDEDGKTRNNFQQRLTTTSSVNAMYVILLIFMDLID